MAIDARVRRLPHKAITIMVACAAMTFVAAVADVAWAQGTATTAPAPSSGQLALFNQVQALESQMQQLQGQIEELQHKLQQWKETSETRYAGLEARLGKRKKGETAAGTASPPTGSAPAASSTPTAGRGGAAAAPPASAGSSGAPPMSSADKAAAQKAYDAAFKTLRKGNYVASARGFRGFIHEYPRSALVPNAYYWLGESYYVTQNFKVALKTFRTLARKYPGSRKAPDARLKIGYCQFEMKDYASARHTLKAVIAAYPGTAVERRAKDRLGAIPVSASTK